MVIFLSSFQSVSSRVVYELVISCIPQITKLINHHSGKSFSWYYFLSCFLCMRSTVFSNNLPLIFLQIRECYQTYAQAQGFLISTNEEPYHKRSYNQSMVFLDLYASSYSHAASPYQLKLIFAPSTFFLHVFFWTCSLSFTSRKF